MLCASIGEEQAWSRQATGRPMGDRAKILAGSRQATPDCQLCSGPTFQRAKADSLAGLSPMRGAQVGRCRSAALAGGARAITSSAGRQAGRQSVRGRDAGHKALQAAAKACSAVRHG